MRCFDFAVLLFVVGCEGREPLHLLPPGEVVRNEPDDKSMVIANTLLLRGQLTGEMQGVSLEGSPSAYFCPAVNEDDLAVQLFTEVSGGYYMVILTFPDADMGYAEGDHLEASDLVSGENFAGVSADGESAWDEIRPDAIVIDFYRQADADMVYSFSFTSGDDTTVFGEVEYRSADDTE